MYIESISKMSKINTKEVATAQSADFIRVKRKVELKP